MSFEPVKRNDVGLLPVATLVIWLVCVVIGVVGYLFPHKAPPPPATQPEPTDAELVNVSLTDQPVAPAAQPLATPQADAAPVPQVPDLPAVAAPSPAIAFALPVDAPMHVVPRAAGSFVPTQVFAGEGDGNQPKPTYPREADEAREEGTVRVDFEVTADGRIDSARITKPSVWPLLNQAALQCVRDQWNFSPRMRGPHFVLIDFKQ